MSKNVIWVVILIIILGVIFVFTKGDKEGAEAPAVPIIEEASVIPETASLINVEESSLKWTGRKTLIATYFDTGRINLKSGFVIYENGVPASGEAVIDMTTIRVVNTGRGGEEENTNRLTEHLSSDDFFNVALYPTSKIIAKSVTPVSGKANTYKVVGELTIRGITNPIEFEAVEVSPKKFTGIVSVDRSIYNVKFGSGKFFSNLGDNIIDDIFTLEFEFVVE